MNVNKLLVHASTLIINPIIICYNICQINCIVNYKLIAD